MDHALQVIEFDAIQERLAQHCQSSLAAKWARELMPSLDPETVGHWRAETREADDFFSKYQLPTLVAVRDIGAWLVRAEKGSVLDGEVLYQIGEAVLVMRELHKALAEQSGYPILQAKAAQIPDHSSLGGKILQSLDSDGEVLDTASPELQRIRKSIQKANAKLTERIHSYISGPQKEYLSDPIVTQRAGRYVVPVKAEHKGRIRGLVHDTSSSGQTIFVEPMDVLELGNALSEAASKERAEITRILTDLSERVGSIAGSVAAGIEQCASIDLIFAKVRLGVNENGVLPETAPDASFSFEGLRHPLLDKNSVVPMTAYLAPEETGILITGPNTGGKTVALKSIGLAVAMAQTGMMVLARHAKMGHFNGLWADIGDEQSLQQSLSTFSAHIKNIGDALRGLTQGALVLLDEVGAGTDPGEGSALAKGILMTIQSEGAKFVGSTHYAELKVFATNTPGFANASMEFDLKTLKPTYRLMMGTPGSSHAFKVAERVGLPKRVVDLAMQQTSAGDQDLAKMLEQLEQSQKRAMKAQSEADRLAHRLRLVEQEAEQKIRLAEEAKKNARKEAAELIEDELRRIRLTAADIFESLRSSAKQEDKDRARQLLKSLNSEGEELAASVRPATTKSSDTIVRGSVVKVVGHPQSGVVLDDPSGRTVRVQIGSMKFSVPMEQLELVPAGKPTPIKTAPKKSTQLEKLHATRIEINLIGLRMEEAERELIRYLDDAVLAGHPAVRIVHGKGNGILKAMTLKVIKKHPGVESFREGEPQEGGHGVTIANLE